VGASISQSVSQNVQNIYNVFSKIAPQDPDCQKALLQLAIQADQNGLVLVPQDQSCPPGTYNGGPPMNGFNGCFPNGMSQQDFSAKIMPAMQNAQNVCSGGKGNPPPQQSCPPGTTYFPGQPDLNNPDCRVDTVFPDGFCAADMKMARICKGLNGRYKTGGSTGENYTPQPYDRWG
jgi:hypothetical protein